VANHNATLLSTGGDRARPGHTQLATRATIEVDRQRPKARCPLDGIVGVSCHTQSLSITAVAALDGRL
jgi:hypothetical protein